ncbi:hypothetical protein RHMOL_Rhmol09G0105900 [Rhododendron molle]|uniref:Uncharacterized protein n=1 Tax=Rhododendron molle TaxID=49168 RepID=A0ACC0MBY4_RHOML|nr:hypothetical protein RHMOL_Rhmol09G0105900 [Rhododendron molle]
MKGETSDVYGGGAGGDDTGPSQTPLRDSAKGKGAIIEEEETTAEPVTYQEADVMFRPAVIVATSSSHMPITKYDVVEHLPDEMLAKLLEDNPVIGELVLKAKEDRARAIEASEAAERAERERAGPEGLAEDVEAEERAAAKAQGPRVRAVDEAGAMTRPKFSADAYVPSVPRLFVPSGFQPYRPQQPYYDSELVLRDPRVHIANTWAEAEQRDIRGFGGACSSLALYESLPARVRQLVDEAGFGEYIRTLSPVRNDHAVLVALAERWRDITNTFHLPPGEMTVTPTEFMAITGLRVGGDPIPFDSGIHTDPVELEWFLGEVPRIEGGAARYAQFKKYLKKKVITEWEAEQMARAYLLYLFRASLFPNRCSTVHLSYLSTLRDLRTTSRFDWGGAALGTTYLFLGDSSKTEQSTAGYWRIWELWAYEVLKMYPPQNKCPDLKTLPRALIWSKEYMGTKEGRGELNAYRLYLDDLKASQIEWNPWRIEGPEPEYLARSRVVTASRELLESAFGWQWYLGVRVTRQSLGYLEFQVPRPLPPRASHTGDYTLAELERFMRPETELTCYLRPEHDYTAYQQDHLEWER